MSGSRSSADPDNRFCYLVMCHTDRESVLRLVARLRELSPEALVVLRHDRGPGFLDDVDVAAWGAHVLHSGIRVAWGGWSMTEATLEALRRVAQEWAPSWTVLISGQDYPVRDLTAWERDVTSSGTDALVAETTNLQHVRHTHRWTVLPPVDGLPRVLRRGLTVAWWRVAAPRQRSVIFYRPPRSGRWLLAVRRLRDPFAHAPYEQASQWLTLSSRAVEALLAADAADPGRRQLFSTTRIPDESYLQTLVCHHTGVNVERRSTTWVRFVGGEPSPRPLSVRDVAEVLVAGTPFARKVDPAADPDPRDVIDAAVDSQRVARS